MVLLAAISAVLGQMRHDAGYAFTVVKNRQPVLGPLLFKVENICLVIADVTKKFLLRRANFVLPPAPHCLQADFPSGGDLLFCHHGVVHFHLLGKCLHDNAVRRRSQARWFRAARHHHALTKRRASLSSKISCRPCAGVGSKPKRR